MRVEYAKKQKCPRRGASGEATPGAALLGSLHGLGVASDVADVLRTGLEVVRHLREDLVEVEEALGELTLPVHFVVENPEVPALAFLREIVATSLAGELDRDEVAFDRDIVAVEDELPCPTRRVDQADEEGLGTFFELACERHVRRPRNLRRGRVTGTLSHAHGRAFL